MGLDLNHHIPIKVAADFSQPSACDGVRTARRLLEESGKCCCQVQGQDFPPQYLEVVAKSHKQVELQGAFTGKARLVNQRCRARPAAARVQTKAGRQHLAHLMEKLAGLRRLTITQRGVCCRRDLNRKRSAPVDKFVRKTRLWCFPCPSPVDAGQPRFPQPSTGLILGCARVLASCSYAPREVRYLSHSPEAALIMSEPFAIFNEGVAWPQLPSSTANGHTSKSERSPLLCTLPRFAYFP